MAYGIHYTLPFNTLATVPCRFDILEKEYAGSVLTLAGGERSPVVHIWDASEILQPVRGSKCVVQYLAKTKTIAGGFSFVDGQVSSMFYTVIFSGVGVDGIVSIDIETVSNGPYSFQALSFNGQTAAEIVQALIAQFDVIGINAAVGTTPESIVVTVIGFGGLDSGSTTVPPPSGLVQVPELPIETFLTTDETKYLGELYLNNVLQFRGYMVIDDFSAPYLTPPTIPTLTFTDGLALLDQVLLSDAGYSVTSGKVAISSIIEKILLLTNLDLPLIQYYNLFPDGSDNRNDDPAIDALGLQYLSIKSFLKDDDGFDNCYIVLEKILRANLCCIMQQQGQWTIVRLPEYKRFAGNIPGSSNTGAPLALTAYWEAGFLGNGGTFTFTGGAAMISYFAIGTTFTISNATDSRFNTTYETNFITTPSGDLRISVYEQPTAPLENVTVTGEFTSTIIPTISISAPALITKVIGKAGDLLPTDRGQNKNYTRPTKKVTNTFNYRIPQLLTNSNLQRLGALIGSSTDGDNTLTDYQLSDWTNQNTAAAFIRVVTNTLTGKEVDRYIVMPWTTSPTGGHESGIVGVPIEVNAGDKFGFSFRYRADHDENSNSIIDMGFALDTSVGRRSLIYFDQSPDSRNNNLRWTTALVGVGTPIQITFPFKFDRAADNMTEWHTFNFMDYDINEIGFPPIPRDGILYIFIRGFNHSGSGYPQYDTYMKDFQFEYFTYINDSVQIIGQENKSSQPIVTKNESATEIFIDDAPKFNIAGGIFKKSGSDFIRTTDWIKESSETAVYRHGELNAVDELLITSNWRTIFEGPFYGLCNPVDSFNIDGVDGMFVPFKLELNYKRNESKMSLQEVNKITDPTFDSLLYNFRFLYK